MEQIITDSHSYGGNGIIPYGTMYNDTVTHNYVGKGITLYGKMYYR